MTDVTVGDIVVALEAAYPPALAESWDQVGLICGDPDDEVSNVAFALDCTLEVAQRAGGPAPELTAYPDDQAEARGVASELRRLVDTGESPAEMAVAPRTVVTSKGVA